MKFNIINCLLIFLGFLILSSCTKVSETTLPDCGIDSVHFNKEIIIVPFDETNSYKINDPFSFTILLKEKDIVVIATMDFDSQIFIYDETNDQWNEVENNVEYLGKSPRLDSNNDKLSFVVRPIIETENIRTKVYLCISGEVENNPEIDVGASYLFILRK